MSFDIDAARRNYYARIEEREAERLAQWERARDEAEQAIAYIAERITSRPLGLVQFEIIESTNRAELHAAIASQIAVLDDIAAFHRESYARPELADERSHGLVVATLLENYYTAAETVLFRIAQEFGNRVSAERWHANLLDRLSRAVEGIRPRVLAADTYTRLDELRRFRHFKRYYYRLDFDRDKLDFLSKKLIELHPMMHRDLAEFVSFLDRLGRDPSPGL